MPPFFIGKGELIIKSFIYSAALAALLIFLAIFQTTGTTDENIKAAVNEELAAEISAVMEHEDLKGAVTGISVRNMQNGEVIYSLNADTRMKPASSMKLVTAASSLQVLGEDYRFSTEVHTDGVQKGNVLYGNLYLKGKGDPTLMEEDLSMLAAELKNKGIKRVTGKLIGDDTWYDDQRYSIDMPWSDEQEYYGAAISALTISPDEDYDAGTVIVEVKATKHGKPPTIQITPDTNYVTIKNKAVTGKPDDKKTIKVTREHGSNMISVEGVIPSESSASKTWTAVWEPRDYGLQLFREALDKQRITIKGKSQPGTLPRGTKIVALNHSETLKEILIPYMKLSNNTISEMLVKEIGKIQKGEGSWEKGLEVIESLYPELGIHQDSILMRDGSGISHVGLVTPNALTALLQNVQQKQWYAEYREALPVAGQKDRRVGGTLRNRMGSTAAAGNVIAKTGTLTTVSSLSGYINTKNGAEYAFSIILNNVKEEDQLKKIEDAIAVILAEHG